MVREGSDANRELQRFRLRPDGRRRVDRRRIWIWAGRINPGHGRSIRPIRRHVVLFDTHADAPHVALRGGYWQANLHDGPKESPPGRGGRSDGECSGDFGHRPALSTLARNNGGLDASLARVLHSTGMAANLRSARILVRRAGVSFFTRRMLQRWERGEIDTDQLVALLRTDDTVHSVRVWSPPKN